MSGRTNLRLALAVALAAVNARAQPARHVARIQYLHSATTGADQKVVRDAELRYSELRKKRDLALRELGELKAGVKGSPR